MNRLDVYYRALLQYRAEVDAKHSCAADNHAVAVTDPKSDNIYFERKSCEIDTTWVDEIEKGLVFIEKAIKEERQFIRSNGEVIPIEKVKNVSKQSVEHLARHSNLITRVTEGEDLIPDALYTVEKLSDYAVYENKFLYMLLCYLRDFITLRYNKIMDISNTYNGSMSMKKSVKTDKSALIYTVELKETRKEDEYLKARNPAKDTIDRIDLLLKTVLAFLATPLMEIVSKVPMLKPPVTKTNVLKMNNNFKGAMDLYAFITSYEGEGFTVHTETRHISPFDQTVAEEMANTVTLASFLTYQHALGIEKELQNSYLAEEQARKDNALKARLEKIENLKIKLKKQEISPEEYIIEVEKALREYEKRFSDYNRLKSKLEEAEKGLAEANGKISELLDRQLDLQKEIERTLASLDAEKQRYIDDMEAKRIEHEEHIAKINEIHEKEIESLHAEQEQRISELKTEQEKRIADVIEEKDRRHEAAMAEKKTEIDELNNRFSESRAEFNKRLAETTEALKKSTEAHSELLENHRLTQAKLLSLKAGQNKLDSEDSFLSEESFDELEKMFNTFKKFYSEEWKRAKKKIRKDLLWTKKNTTDVQGEKNNTTEVQGEKKNTTDVLSEKENEERKEQASIGASSTDISNQNNG